MKELELHELFSHGGLPLATQTSRWDAHEKAITALKFCTDQNILISGSFDGKIKLWTSERELLASVNANTHAITCLACSGKIIASGGFDGGIRVWDISDLRHPTLRFELIGHSDWVTAIDISDAGDVLVSVSHDGTLRVWEIKSGTELHRFSGDGASLASMCVNTLLNVVYTGSVKGTLYSFDLYDPSGLTPRAQLDVPISAMAMLREDGIILVGTMNYRLVKLSAAGQVVGTSQRMPSWPTSICVDEKRRVAVVSAADLTLRVWRLDDLAFSGFLPGPSASLGAVDTGSCGGVYWGDDLGGIAQAKLDMDETAADGHEGSVWSVAIDSSARIVLSGSSDGTVRVWDVSTGQHVRTLSGHQGWVNSVALSADGTRALSGSSDGTVRVWDVSTGQPVETLYGHTRGVTSVYLSANRQMALSTGYDGVINRWKLSAQCTLSLSIGAHQGCVWGVSAAGQGSVAASASSDATLKVWDVESGLLLEKRDLGATATACALVETSPNEYLLAFAQRGGHVGLMRMTAQSVSGPPTA